MNLELFGTSYLGRNESLLQFHKKAYGSLKGQTPAEAAKITVDGKNKWKIIIQNASLYKGNSV